MTAGKTPAPAQDPTGDSTAYAATASSSSSQHNWYWNHYSWANGTNRRNH